MDINTSDLDLVVVIMAGGVGTRFWPGSWDAILACQHSPSAETVSPSFWGSKPSANEL